MLKKGLTQFKQSSSSAPKSSECKEGSAGSVTLWMFNSICYKQRNMFLVIQQFKTILRGVQQ